MALNRALTERLSRGWALYKQGRFAEAEGHFAAVQKVAPNDHDARRLLGMALMQMGRDGEAVEHFRAALQRLPRDTAVLNNLASALRTIGKPDEALAFIRQAIVLAPDVAEFYNTRGNALLDIGRLQEALDDFDQAICRKVTFAEAYFNRSVALQAQRRSDEALAAVEHAVRLKPDYAKAHARRGQLLQAFGRPVEALASYTRAVALTPSDVRLQCLRGVILRDQARHADALAAFDAALAVQPDLVEALIGRGMALMALRRGEEAVAAYDMALARKPDAADALTNRANALRLLQRFDAALASVDAALALQPNFAEAWLMRGNVLRDLWRIEEVLVCMETALVHNPALFEAHINRGLVMQDVGRYADAAACFEAALRLRPGDPEAQWGIALLHLRQGDMATGWRAYEWRKQVPGLVQFHKLPQPEWLGDADIGGRKLFLHWEQGLGDTIQFCRYAVLAADRGAEVTLSVQSPLLALLAGLDARIRVVDERVIPAGIELHCPLLSLPLAFGTTLATIPAHVPYLTAPPDRRARMEEKLRAVGNDGQRPRVGIVWRGNALHSNDRNRSTSLEMWGGLFALPLAFVSLQKDIRSDEADVLAGQPNTTNLGPGLTDFADTAAAIAELDMVITVDSSVAHLAGALGKPVWILLPYNPDFRWMRDRACSPWYPTARLFRQQVAGDWEAVFSEVRAALAQADLRHALSVPEQASG